MELKELVISLKADDEVWICDERGDYIFSGKVEDMPDMNYEVLRYYKPEQSRLDIYEIVVDKGCL